MFPCFVFGIQTCCLSSLLSFLVKVHCGLNWPGTHCSPPALASGVLWLQMYSPCPVRSLLQEAFFCLGSGIVGSLKESEEPSCLWNCHPCEKPVPHGSCSPMLCMSTRYEELLSSAARPGRILESSAGLLDLSLWGSGLGYQSEPVRSWKGEEVRVGLALLILFYCWLGRLASFHSDLKY